MATLLGDLPIGARIPIKENGAYINYIVVHKGLPSKMYDNSCDGVWVLREFGDFTGTWSGGDNDYENSNINAWLNGEFLNSLDLSIQSAIKDVKIPFKKGTGNDTKTFVQSGADGLPCKVFLLSGYEVGFTAADADYLPVDGAKLDYFLSGGTANELANVRRIFRQIGGTAVNWCTRSPNNTTYNRIVWVSDLGIVTGNMFAYTASYYWIRPAFILPANLSVNTENGTVETNTPPEITANKSGDLGTLTDGFDVGYSVKDADSDTVTVTETLDSVNVRRFKAVPDKAETYSLRDKEWLKTENGSHSFTISASDGKNTTEHSITFTRDQTSLSVTLEKPFTADDNIIVCKLTVDGEIPDDAICKYEVTNNALDSSPVWEDCTEETKAGRVHVFKSSGSAFCFRVSIKRGSSGKGGYITKISGGYE